MPETTSDKTASPHLRQILLPTDFSGCANYAMPYAASIARVTQAKIICVHVVEPVVPTVGYTGLAEPLPFWRAKSRPTERRQRHKGSSSS